MHIAASTAFKHPSSTYCSSTPPESAFASLVPTTICNASLQVHMMNAGLRPPPVYNNNTNKGMKYSLTYKGSQIPGQVWQIQSDIIIVKAA